MLLRLSCNSQPSVLNSCLLLKVNRAHVFEQIELCRLLKYVYVCMCVCRQNDVYLCTLYICFEINSQKEQSLFIDNYGDVYISMLVWGFSFSSHVWKKIVSLGLQCKVPYLILWRQEGLDDKFHTIICSLLSTTRKHFFKILQQF